MRRSVSLEVKDAGFGNYTIGFVLFIVNLDNGHELVHATIAVKFFFQAVFVILVVFVGVAVPLIGFGVICLVEPLCRALPEPLECRL